MDNIDIDEIINSNMTVTDHLLRDAIHSVVIDALSKADERIEELEKITGDMSDQIIAYHEKQMERIDYCLYESGLTAQGCWDELDDYAKQSIMRFAELLLAVPDGNEKQESTFQSQE